MDDKQQLQHKCNTVFPRDIVCVRNIRVNTLQQGDNDYDDNDHNTVQLGQNVMKGTEYFVSLQMLQVPVRSGLVPQHI